MFYRKALRKLRKQFLAYPAIHLMAVHGYSRLIAQMENVDGHTLFITEVAAYLHDIGVKVSKEKYGNSQPQHQEAEGPAIARKLLEPLSLPAPDVERICFIIGHHHTYKAIDGLYFQILVEADSGFKIFSKTGKRLSQDFKRAEANVS